MSRTLKHLLAILGFRPEAATMSTSRALRVYARVPDGERQHIGTLTVEDGEFVFRYTSEFIAKPTMQPISYFPDLRREYRSANLWTFFQIRIPPMDRADVAEALGRRKVDPSDVLSVLDTVARKTIANPYEVELAPAA